MVLDALVTRGLEKRDREMLRKALRDTTNENDSMDCDGIGMHLGDSGLGGREVAGGFLGQHGASEDGEDAVFRNR